MKSRTHRVVVGVAGLAVPLIALASLAGCARSGVTPVAGSANPSSAPTAQYTPDTADPAAATTAPTDTTSSPSPEGPVGTTFQVTDSDGNAYTVTLIKIIDPAKGSDEFNQPDNGKRFVGAVFSITGQSGNSNDDANSDAVLIGSDGQEYDFDSSTIVGYTNFNYGSWNVSPGKTVKGAVVFQVPTGIKVQSVQWGGMFSSSAATWDN